ncbi:unnamed protein product [Acanthoscelides obtectus]|nr:unnamed protein product [Acanthoscelides obtectus]CAK1666281.1 hypothetical protein AOBTE_LOCUS25238 [Acanthoscelides obtectus]
MILLRQAVYAFMIPLLALGEANHWLTTTGNFIQKCLILNKVNATDEKALPTIKKCIQKRLLIAVDRAIYSEVIKVGDGVELVKMEGSKEDRSLLKVGRGLEDMDIETGGGWKNHILRKLAELFRTHVLKVKLATITPTREVEGRGRRKKDMFGHMLMFGLVAAGLIVIPLGFKFLAVLGGKALLLAKMALLLTSIQGLKKIATSNFNYGLYSTFPAQHPTGHGPWHYDRKWPYDPSSEGGGYGNYGPGYDASRFDILHPRRELIVHGTT